MRSFVITVVFCFVMTILDCSGNSLWQSGVRTDYVLPGAETAKVYNVRQMSELPSWGGEETLKAISQEINGTAFSNHRMFQGDLRPENISQLIVIKGASGPKSTTSTVSVINLLSAHSGRNLIDEYAKGRGFPADVQERDHNGSQYFHVDSDDPEIKVKCIFLPDSSTVVITNNESDMFRLLDQNGSSQDPMVDALANLNGSSDFNMVILKSERTEMMMKLYWGSRGYRGAKDWPKHVEKLVLTASFPPRAEYQATVTFDNEQEAQRIHGEVQQELNKAIAAVEKQLPKSKASSSGEYGVAELHRLLEATNLEQSGNVITCRLESVKDMDIYRLDEAIKAYTNELNEAATAERRQAKDRKRPDSNRAPSDPGFPSGDPAAVEEAAVGRMIKHLAEEIERNLNREYPLQQSHGNAMIIQRCAQLADMGPYAAAALPTLKKVEAEAKDEKVREAAKAAIEKIEAAKTTQAESGNLTDSTTARSKQGNQGSGFSSGKRSADLSGPGRSAESERWLNSMIEVIESYLENDDPDFRTRQYSSVITACRQLRLMGADAEAALPTLRKLEADIDDQRLLKWAKRAIEKIEEAKNK